MVRHQAQERKPTAVWGDKSQFQHWAVSIVDAETDKSLHAQEPASSLEEPASSLPDKSKVVTPMALIYPQLVAPPYFRRGLFSQIRTGVGFAFIFLSPVGCVNVLMHQSPTHQSKIELVGVAITAQSFSLRLSLRLPATTACMAAATMRRCTRPQLLSRDERGRSL